MLEAKLARGQLDQLAAWSARVSDRRVSGSSRWLLYGRARICFLREDAAALAPLRATPAAPSRSQDDLVGQQLCAAGVLEWIYNTDSFADHERWCELMRRRAR